MLEKKEWTINNWPSRETDHNGHNTQCEDQKKKTKTPKSKTMSNTGLKPGVDPGVCLGWATLA